MRYFALATDYDGTLARHGRVDAATLQALGRLAATGRRLILVTGRELPDLQRVFPELDRFDLVVAENGALLYTPATRATRLLAAEPAPAFVSELTRRGVAPLSVGSCIVATWHPQETTVLEVIRELGLELHVIFNKGAVMVLPAGVNKATGLLAGLEALGLSPHNVVAIGDAENDHALLHAAEVSVAVANAVPMLKAGADCVTSASHGAGVAELIDELIESDLANRPTRGTRRTLLLGTRADGAEVRIPAAGRSILVAGTSGSGKSTLTASLLEQLMAERYQCCVVDPEGDYDELPDMIVFGSVEHPPGVTEVMTALERPDASVVVNLLGVKLQDRPAFFARLLMRIQEERARTGRPHWLLVDEAHHLVPADWQSAPLTLTQALGSIIYVTVHPDALAPAALENIDVVAALGETPHKAVAAAANASRRGAPADSGGKADGGGARAAFDADARQPLEPGHALVWIPGAINQAMPIAVAQSHRERRRHLRKYAKGELGPDRSFFFRGPGNRLKLRAQNLVTFLQLAEGVDEETWLHHLRNGDYSQWLATCIKDEALAEEVRQVERTAPDLGAAQSLAHIRAAIEQRYTLPEKAGVL